MAAEQALSRRERQILDIVFARGEATVAEVMEDHAEDLSRSAVRTFLRILEDKGHLKHTERGRGFVYSPVQSKKSAGKSAVKRVLSTFFSGSLESALATYLADGKTKVTDEELERIAELIEQARKEGR